MAFRPMTTSLTFRAASSEEDLPVALPPGSRGVGRNTVGRRGARIQEDGEREPPFKKQKSTDEVTGESSTTLPTVMLTPPTAAAPSANATERTRFSRFGARILGIDQETSLRTVRPTPPPVISVPRRVLQQMVNLLLPSISRIIGWVAVQATKGIIWVIGRVGSVLIFPAAGGIFFAVDLARRFDGSEAHEALIRLMGRLFDLFYDDGEDDEEEEGEGEDTTPAPSEPKRIEGTTASPQPAKCTCGEASSSSNSAERCAIHSSTFTGPKQQDENGPRPTVLPAAHTSRREPVPVRVQIAARHLLRTRSNEDRRHPALSPYLRNNGQTDSHLQQSIIRSFQNRGRFRPIPYWRNTASSTISPIFWQPTLGTLRARQNAARRQFATAPFQPSVFSRSPVFNGPSVNVAANFNNTLYPLRPQLPPPPTQTINVYSVQTLMNHPPQNNSGNVLYAYHNDPNAWDPSGLIMGLSHGPLPPPPPPSPPISTQIGPLHFVDFNGHRFVFEWETPGSRDLVDFLAQAEWEFRNSSISGFDRQKCIDLFNGKIQSLISAAENLAGYPRVAVLPLLSGLVEQPGGTA
ncbi:hypothetical protein KC333_g5063 [Hortaea werneckii]|nr:hypothetical protein KC333_g5063 [Hortaea werneckii]KAI7324099.1 hypothetical protein KC326_g1183 [Hortaea werneckii]